MIESIVVSEKAASEIRKIVSWYNKQLDDLSKRFIDELNQLLNKIQNIRKLIN